MVEHFNRTIKPLGDDCSCSKAFSEKKLILIYDDLTTRVATQIPYPENTTYGQDIFASQIEKLIQYCVLVENEAELYWECDFEVMHGNAYNSYIYVIQGHYITNNRTYYFTITVYPKLKLESLPDLK